MVGFVKCLNEVGGIMVGLFGDVQVLNKSWRLDKCDLYVTVEPCVMCTGAMLASRIKNLYFAEFDPKFGACGSLYNLAEEKKYNHKINVYSGLYAAESRNLLKMFFEKLRKANTTKSNIAEIYKLPRRSKNK